MFSPPQTLKLEGQEFIFNPESNVVVLEITQEFVSAGKQIGWDIENFGSPGFGINQAIINFIISRKSRLKIILLSTGQQYWIFYDHIKHFIKHNPCKYTISGKELIVIPWRLFASFPPGGKA